MNVHNKYDRRSNGSTSQMQSGEKKSGPKQHNFLVYLSQNTDVDTDGSKRKRKRRQIPLRKNVLDTHLNQRTHTRNHSANLHAFRSSKEQQHSSGDNLTGNKDGERRQIKVVLSQHGLLP